jgi:nitroreductase
LQAFLKDGNYSEFFMKNMILFLKKITRPMRMAWNKVYREKYVFPRLSKDTLRAVIRHEAHRVEKSYYNNVFNSKKKVYMEKADNIIILSRILNSKGGDLAGPDMAWSKKIALNADSLDKNFINYNNSKNNINCFFKSKEAKMNVIKELFHNRRSVRVWSEMQQSEHERSLLAARLIQCAINMPTSGNRQAARFIIFNSREQKDLLKGLKESHCYNAPLVIGVFSDESLYGSYGTFSKTEECLFIDAAAASSAILIAAELEGYSTCWNHFGQDLIMSRKTNRQKFDVIQKTYSLSKYIRPIALIAIGTEEFQPPVPLRMALEDYIYND